MAVNLTKSDRAGLPYFAQWEGVNMLLCPWNMWGQADGRLSSGGVSTCTSLCVCWLCLLGAQNLSTRFLASWGQSLSFILYPLCTAWSKQGWFYLYNRSDMYVPISASHPPLQSSQNHLFSKRNVKCLTIIPFPPLPLQYVLASSLRWPTCPQCNLVIVPSGHAFPPV